MLTIEVDYVSFLLRLWQSDENGRLVWRASLECAQTVEKLYFASLGLLLDYLLRVTGQCKG